MFKLNARDSFSALEGLELDSQPVGVGSDEPVVEVEVEEEEVKAPSKLKDMKKICLTIETQDFTNPLTLEQEAYKERIKDFLDMQKVTLTFKATQAGLDDVLVKEFLTLEKISDFDFDNF